jgi:peptidoglycan hydrolase CwlO-like protein
MSEGVIIAIIGILIVPIGAFLTWFFNRKSNVSVIYKALTESAQTSVETMQATMQTLHDELENAQTKIDELIVDNKKMQYEIGQLRQQNLLLLQENHTLHTKIDELTQLIASQHPDLPTAAL